MICLYVYIYCEMWRIGLVPMSGKPVHAGHVGLIELAAGECDEVHVFVSTSDRARKGEAVISGEAMRKIWNLYLEPTMPNNVEIHYGGIPVRKVYEMLAQEEAQENEDMIFVIYSDAEDILKYTDESLSKFAPSLYANEQIELRGVERQETVDVSGTKMREYMTKGDIKNFKKFKIHRCTSSKSNSQTSNLRLHQLVNKF